MEQYVSCRGCTAWPAIPPKPNDGNHDCMGWLTTTDLDEFRQAATGYLHARGAEGTLLLSAARVVRDDRPLAGWWAAAEGTEVRGAFLHDTPAPLVIVGGVPEVAAALAPVLHSHRRHVCGVDATLEAADAFAAAWTPRTGTAARLRRHVKVYRMAGAAPDVEGPHGQARPATLADWPLLVDWIRACGTEAGDFSRQPEDVARELLSYDGAIFWEVGGQAVALGTFTRPVEHAVRLGWAYTPHSDRHHGFAAAVTVAASRAALSRPEVSEVLLISDRTSPVRRAQALGYELASERVELSFGPPTGPLPRLTGPLPRLTGPLARLRGNRADGGRLEAALASKVAPATRTPGKLGVQHRMAGRPTRS